MYAALWYSALVIVAASLLGSALQAHWRNATHADLLWAGATSLVSLHYLLIGPGAVWPRLLAGLLLLIWGARLVCHLVIRMRSGPEDGRYQAIRAHYGERINRFHVAFFLGQGLLAWLFAMPAWVLAFYPEPVAWGWLLAGLVVGGAGLLGEAVADRQLALFKRHAAVGDQVCCHGLWRYSRHPNYFFEWLHWLAYPLMAVGIPLGYWLWLAPLAMFVFVRFVSGVPYAEQQSLRSRGEAYRRYQQTTPVFFPGRARP